MVPVASPTLADSLDRPAAAAYIGVSASTLALWAHNGKHRDLLLGTASYVTGAAILIASLKRNSVAHLSSPTKKPQRRQRQQSTRGARKTRMHSTATPLGSQCLATSGPSLILPPIDSTSQPLDQAILDIVRRIDWVSFAELPRRLEEAGHHDIKGDMALEIQSNAIVWAGFSAAMVDALRRLLSSKRLFLHPASTLTYLVDGMLLTLPVAKRPPAGGYKSPHWLPCCLRVVPIGAARKERRQAA